MKQTKVETRYYKIKMNKGETKFEFHKYATAKVTPMHERIRTHYPAETVFGNVIQPEKGLWGFFVVEKTIASDDWQWAKAAAQKLIKEKRKKTLIQPPPLS